MHARSEAQFVPLTAPLAAIRARVARGHAFGPTPIRSIACARKSGGVPQGDQLLST